MGGLQPTYDPWYRLAQMEPRTRILEQDLHGRSWRATYDPRAQSLHSNPEVWVDGIRFENALKAEHYEQLTGLREAGRILGFSRNVSFDAGAGTCLKVDWMVLRKGPPVFAMSMRTERAAGRKRRERLLDLHGIEVLLWAVDVLLPPVRPRRAALVAA